jgi:hypothetical protein
MRNFRKWSWVIITILSLANIVYVSLSEGFIEGKVWPFLVTLGLGLYFCYNNFIRKK